MHYLRCTHDGKTPPPADLRPGEPEHPLESLAGRGAILERALRRKDVLETAQWFPASPQRVEDEWGNPREFTPVELEVRAALPPRRGAPIAAYSDFAATLEKREECDSVGLVLELPEVDGPTGGQYHRIQQVKPYGLAAEWNSKRSGGEPLIEAGCYVLAVNSESGSSPWMLEALQTSTVLNMVLRQVEATGEGGARTSDPRRSIDTEKSVVIVEQPMVTFPWGFKTCAVHRLTAPAKGEIKGFYSEYSGRSWRNVPVPDKALAAEWRFEANRTMYLAQYSHGRLSFPAWATSGLAEDAPAGGTGPDEFTHAV